MTATRKRPHVTAALKCRRLSIVLNRELIRKSPIFRSLDNRSIVLVLRRLTTLTLPPETVALRQGQPNSAMYFVSRGLLIVLEDEQVVGTLTDQDCFGEDSMVRRAAAARPSRAGG